MFAKYSALGSEIIILPWNTTRSFLVKWSGVPYVTCQDIISFFYDGGGGSRTCCLDKTSSTTTFCYIWPKNETCLKDYGHHHLKRPNTSGRRYHPFCGPHFCDQWHHLSRQFYYIKSPYQSIVSSQLMQLTVLTLSFFSSKISICKPCFWASIWAVSL